MQTENSDENVGLAFLLVICAGLATGIGAAFVFSPRLVSYNYTNYTNYTKAFASLATVIGSRSLCDSTQRLQRWYSAVSAILAQPSRRSVRTREGER